MAKAGVESLWQAEPPWTVTWRASRANAYELAWKVQGSGAVARVLRGSKMTTLDGFFTELGAALQLPDYFAFPVSPAGAWALRSASQLSATWRAAPVASGPARKHIFHHPSCFS